MINSLRRFCRSPALNRTFEDRLQLFLKFLKQHMDSTWFCNRGAVRKPLNLSWRDSGTANNCSSSPQPKQPTEVSYI